MPARGVLYVHSCPPALCPHVEWAAASVLGVRVRLPWTDQPVEGGALRAELTWWGRAGTAAMLAAAVRGWTMLRWEVAEEPSSGCDGERFSYTPSLGVYRAATSANGDVVVGEDRLRTLLPTSGDVDGLALALDRLLGREWDAELEPYRYAGDGAPTHELHQVG